MTVIAGTKTEMQVHPKNRERTGHSKKVIEENSSPLQNNRRKYFISRRKRLHEFSFPNPDSPSDELPLGHTRIVMDSAAGENVVSDIAYHTGFGIITSVTVELASTTKAMKKKMDKVRIN